MKIIIIIIIIIYVTTSESRNLTLNASGFKDRIGGQIIIIILTDSIYHCTAFYILYFNIATGKGYCHHVTREVSGMVLDQK